MAKNLKIEEPGVTAPTDENETEDAALEAALDAKEASAAPTAEQIAEAQKILAAAGLLNAPEATKHVDPTKLGPTERVLTSEGWVVPASQPQIIDHKHPQYVR